MTTNYNVIIGSYGPEENETIHWLKFDPITQNFTKISATTGIENPSFLIVNHQKTHVYAVSEVDEGEVVSYEIDYEHNVLRELNRQPTKGGPCFLAADEHDRYLLTANYGGGSVIVHPLLVDGQIGSYTYFHEYGSDHEPVAHAHAIKNIPDTSLFVVTDLGRDALYVCELDDQNGKLKRVTELKTTKGAGPRHIAFHPEFNRMYLLNQDDSTVLVYSYHSNDRTFEQLQVVSTLLEPFSGTNYGADIHLSICKQFLYVSNRGHHSMTAYQILPDGQLEPIAHTPSGGEWPRNFAVVPNDKHVIVANEHTDNLAVMKISSDGRLKDTGCEMSVSKPVCIHFF